MKRTALLVSNKYPLPMDDGKKAVLGGFVDYLCDRFGADEVTHVVIGPKPAEPPPALPCRAVWIDPPSRWRQAWNALKSLLGVSPLSLQEAFTWSPTVQRELEALTRETNPALVVLDTIRIGQYFASPRTSDFKRVLYMDDLYSLRFKRMLEMTAADPEADINPVGTFASMLPKPVRAVLKLGLLRDGLYRVEIKKVRRREFTSPMRFDRCLLINPIETDLVRRRSKRKNVYAVKPLLSAETVPIERNFTGEPVFVMFGSLRHPVYRASVLRFLTQCSEAMVQTIPGVRIRLIGDGADDHLREVCERLGPHIEVCGFVDDIAAEFSTACALIVPLLAAGGLKLKAVTAMRHGLPLITTGAGIDGIPLLDGISCIKEDDIDQYVPAMMRMLDVPYNNVLSQNALQVFDRHFSREGVFREYDKLFLGRKPTSIDLGPAQDASLAPA